MSDKYNGSYPTAWSQGEIALYEQTGREPAKTRNGLWVNDVERETRDLVDWSLAELFALANGELYSQYETGTGEFYRAVRIKALLVDKDALKWGEEELFDWLMFERTPEKTPNGNYLNDPDRWVKDASKWNDSELVDLGCGYFGELDRSRFYILDEACDRFELPHGITWDDYCTYIRERIRPAVTASGVLINSRTRDAAEASSWDENELYAWLNGEIQASPDKEAAVLTRAIEEFGGGRYWTKDDLIGLVIHDTIPDIDYTAYTDEQLKVLAEQDNDLDAKQELVNRQPTPEPEPIEEPDDEPVETLEEELRDPDPVEQPLDTPVEEPGGLRPDDELAESEVEEIIPIAPEKVWTDFVPEGTELHGLLVARTPDVVIADKQRRHMLSASQWQLVELVGWARGDIEPGLNTTEATLIAALRLHCGAFVSHWTDDAVKAFIARLELPEGLAEGMLVEDIVRDKKYPSDWSDEELKAWAAGKIRSKAMHFEIMMTLRVHFKAPGHLNDEQVKRFVATGEYDEQVIAPITDPISASDAQLKAWLDGKMTVSPELEAELFALVRGRHRIDAHWTDQHVLAHFRNGSQPALTGDGVMVEDRLRDSRSPAKWTWKELKALKRSEIEADFTVDSLACMDRIRELARIQYGHAEVNWSDDEVLAFLDSQITPKALESGVYINDPTRATRVATAWTDAELKAWLNGDIRATAVADEDQLWQEVYVRFKVPVFWYREDAKSYVLQGTEVPATPSGIWLRDRNRDARPAKYWTRREIKAWCRGLILPGINAPADELVRQACHLFGVSTLLDSDSVKRRIADITEESMTMTVKFVTDDLASYAKGREEAGSNAVKAAPFQTLLDRCIGRVLRLEGEDFVQGWTELLLFFHKHSNGITSAKKLYVGVGQMAITPKGLRNFQNMTAILLTTCDPANRDRAVRLTEWTTALKELPNEKSRQQLLAYYGK